MVLMGVASLGLALSAAPGWAVYPEKPIKVIVPNPPGGSLDVIARVFQKALEKALPQPIVVVNVVGGGTSIGSRQVKEAPADGHTVLVNHQALMTAAATGVADFGPEAFTPVAQTGADPTVFIVHKSAPINSLKDLFAAASAAPNTLKAGVQIGALNHLATLAAAKAGGDVKFRYVQTGGGAPSLTALMGQHIDITQLPLSVAASYHRSGDVRIIALFEPARHPDVPDVPAAREQGYDVVLPIMNVWWMPKGTPQDRVDAFASALEKAMDDPEVRRHLKDSLMSAVFVRGSALGESVDRELRGVRELATTAVTK
jgi:tripartite-type tricarboxylate transporter receptor subunit TctC